MRAGLALSLAFAQFSFATSASCPSLDLTRFESPSPDFGLARGPDGWYLSRMTGPFGTDAGSEMIRFPYSGGPAEDANFGTETNAGRDFSWAARARVGCFVRDGDIWCSLWMRDGWRKADHMPSPINTDGYEASPYYAPDDTLYFASVREGGMGQGDIYRAKPSADGWQVELLGPAINSPTGEWNLTLSPDGSMMVFEASGRPTNRTVSGDLYLSCLIDGEWSEAQPMSALNTDDSDLDFRFTGMREGVFTTATIGGDGRLRYAGPENFADCP